MKLRVLLVPVAAGALFLAACGDSGSGSSSATTTTAPATGSGAAGGYAIPSDATPTSAAASGGGSAAAAPGTVVAKSVAYHPDKITVKVGEKVTFKNEDSFAHTFTADKGEFDSSNVDGGGEFAFVPEQAGTIAFHCKIHSNMHGTITVTS